jgi:HEAT repeat protein
MTNDAIRQDLQNPEVEKRIQAIRYLAEHEARPTLFTDIISCVADSDDRVRFWALTAMVWRYQTELLAHAKQLVHTLIECLLDHFGPVADRAIWALNIIGETALPHLLVALEAEHTQLRIMAAYALRQNHRVRVAADQVISVLLQLLNDAEEDVRFTAMVVLMDMSPLRSIIGLNLQNIDYEPVYDRLLPVVNFFSSHEVEDKRDWSHRYKELLNTHQQG